MIIFAKKRFAFDYRGQTFIVPRINDFIEVPDWVSKSELYRLALACGDVREMKQETIQIAVPEKKGKSPRKETPTVNPAQAVSSGEIEGTASDNSEEDTGADPQ